VGLPATFAADPTTHFDVGPIPTLLAFAPKPDAQARYKLARGGLANHKGAFQMKREIASPYKQAVPTLPGRKDTPEIILREESSPYRILLLAIKFN
jgi:hypothetical protein